MQKSQTILRVHYRMKVGELMVDRTILQLDPVIIPKLEELELWINITQQIPSMNRIISCSRQIYIFQSDPDMKNYDEVGIWVQANKHFEEEEKNEKDQKTANNKN